VDVQVKGNPTPEELAAALVVLLGRPAAAAPAPTPAASRWADRQRHLRGYLPRGAGAWRHGL
jgi:hypothetical protein